MRWDAFTKMVLMGLNRVDFQPDADGINLQPNEEPAKVFLDKLVVARQKKRAAVAPVKYPSVAPSGGEKKQIQEKIAPLGLFEKLFYRQLTEVLPEAVYWLNKTGLKSVPEFTPEWMSWLAKNPHYRLSVAQCMTKRAIELINLNPDWRSILGQPLLSDWHYGELTLRTQWLEVNIVADPEYALSSLRAVWESEPAAHRKAFIQIVVKNAPIAGIRILEQALHDRAYHVRLLAAKGVMKSNAQILNSAVREALESGLTVKEDLWIWKIPDHVPEALQPLIPSGKSKKGSTRNAPLFQTLVTLVDPQFWLEHTGLEPSEILTHLEKLGVFEAIVEAALLHNRAPWIRAVLAMVMQENVGKNMSSHHLSRLVNRMPAKELHDLLEIHVPDRGHINKMTRKVVELVVDRPESWSINLTGKFVDRLHVLEQMSRSDWDVKRNHETWLTWLCYRGDPFFYEEVRSALFRSRSGWKEWDNKVDDLLKTWHFRKEMIGFFRKAEKN